jgi:hypothetical protein
LARRGSVAGRGLVEGVRFVVRRTHGKELCGEEALDREGHHCGEAYKQRSSTVVRYSMGG